MNPFMICWDLSMSDYFWLIMMIKLFPVRLPSYTVINVGIYMVPAAINIEISCLTINFSGI